MAELVDRLLRRHGDKTLEFKLDLSSPDRVVASIVAFGNAAGGVVLIGVEDSSCAVRGLPDPTEVEERLANLVSDRIEQWGSGIRRMVDACREAGKPDPLIEELAGRVRVTFRFDEHAERLLGARDRRLLELMEPDGVTSAAAAAELGVSDRTARKLLAALAGRGLAVAVGSSPNDPHRRYMATPAH